MSHDETRGCIMDFDESMKDILVATETGLFFCNDCKTQLLRAGSDFLISIANSTNVLLQSKKQSDVLSTRFNLRDKRRKEAGEIYSYDIALLFTSEDKNIAELLANKLIKKEMTVFYNNFDNSQLWAEDLYTYFSDLFRLRASCCVMLLSKHFVNKLLNNYERESALKRAISENSPYILPVNIDNFALPGFMHSIYARISYLNWNEERIDDIVNALVDKIRMSYTNVK